MIAKLNAETAKVRESPEMKKQLLAHGVEARTSTPKQFGALIKSGTANWEKIIADAEIKEWSAQMLVANAERNGITLAP